MKRRVNTLLFIGIIGTATFGFAFAADYIQAIWGDKDIWWTPVSMALPLQATAKDFEILVRDELLQDHLKRGSLSVVDKAGQLHPVVSDDVKVRLNNWNKTKASMLHSAVFTALLAGSAVTFLILGIVQLLKREEFCEQAAPADTDKSHC